MKLQLSILSLLISFVVTSAQAEDQPQVPISTPAVTAEIPAPVPAPPKWTIGSEARFRYEARENSDFSDAGKDFTSFVGTRFRLNVGFSPIPTLEGFFQPQFSGQWGQVASSVVGNATVTGGAMTSGALLDPTLSLHQGFVLWKMHDDVKLKVGRQEMLYGDQVVIGPVGYSNVGRSFDALKLHFYGDKRWVETFYAKLAEDDTKNSGLLSESHLAGLYTSYADLGPIDVADGYVLWFMDERAGGSAKFNFATLGIRLSDRMNDLDSRFEGNIQTGKSSGADMLSYMFDVEAGYKLPVKDGLRLALEYNHASGDDPASGKFTRYHQLFPTAHRWLGYMDFFGRQNIQSGVFHASLKYDPKWTLALDVHSFWRVEKNDLVYSIVAETPLAGQAAASTTQQLHVGEEADVVIAYKYNDNVTLETMGGVFLPGGYVRTSLGKDLAYFTYLQGTFVF